jgi:hypothetical protein
VTVYDRLDIAHRYHAPNRPWGEVVGMAREYELSRQAIYDITGRATVLFEPRLPGPVPCLKRLLPCETISQPVAKAKASAQEEAERKRNRLILTSVFPGGVTMRPLEEILKEAPVEGRSDTSIWRFVNESGAKAHPILTQVDYANVSLPLIVVDIDETFFDGYPVLFVVEPLSLSICGFHVPSDGDRSSNTWAPFLLTLQEDQHLDIYAGVGDAAKPYPGTLQAILERDDGFQEDIFHQLRDLNRRSMARRKHNRRCSPACTTPGETTSGQDGITALGRIARRLCRVCFLGR